MKNRDIVFKLKYAIYFFLIACGVQKKDSFLETSSIPKKLSEWKLFVVKDNKIFLEEGVVPYDLINPLFSDYAVKFRTIKIPEEKKIEYKKDGVFEFPMYSVISKTFAYRLVEREETNVESVYILEKDDIRILRDKFRVETRILVKTPKGWLGLPYVWDKDQRDATLKLTGKSLELNILDEEIGEKNLIYKVPNFNQCKGCHVNLFDYQKVILPIGPQAKNLNFNYDYGKIEENQLRHWFKVGLIDKIPDLESIPKVTDWSDVTLPLEERARGYLDINCAHCHSRKGYANTSGLYLDTSNMDRRRLGVCKPPVAAGNASGGRLFDIVPQKPEESILYYRMQSVASEVMMPEIGRSLQHKKGLKLIYQWISNMDGDCS